MSEKKYLGQIAFGASHDAWNLQQMLKKEGIEIEYAGQIRWPSGYYYASIRLVTKVEEDEDKVI